MVESTIHINGRKDSYVRKAFLLAVPPLLPARPARPEQASALYGLIGPDAVARLSATGSMQCTTDRYSNELFVFPYASWAIMLRPIRSTTSLARLTPKDIRSARQVKMDFCLIEDYHKLQSTPRLVFLITKENAFLKRRTNSDDINGSMRFLTYFFDIAQDVGKKREVVIHPADEKRSKIYAYYLRNRPLANVRLEPPPSIR